ncbi:hypothetical protein FSARC_14618 [Fusarium sarcochroum]|uniref:PD-(D/E)XK nuclease-like domain-containing protein n=1 Tax=Fusarium sarcochroum TaxID=1208366 RepID=A0A8H4WP18_9HYPO|nr:hypothetical protein FSARC_14618 [Fusarium sarcochroum]
MLPHLFPRNCITDLDTSTDAKIDPRYLPLMRDDLTTSSSKMVDYAVSVNDKNVDQTISKFIIESNDSNNHIYQILLRYRPILLGVETKTVAHTEAEARV